VQQAINEVGKKVKASDVIDVVSPINENAAPDHHEQQREIDPVKPPDRYQMLETYLLHVAVRATRGRYWNITPGTLRRLSSNVWPILSRGN
jgi:hypothetical protein